MSVRQSLGITQKTFAQLLGITENSYALIERGERAASSSVKKLILIAKNTPVCCTKLLKFRLYSAP